MTPSVAEQAAGDQPVERIARSRASGNAATGNPAVKALVYIDAFIPARGENLLQLAGAKPGSTLADPTKAFNPVPFTGPAGADTDLYVKPSVYRADFGADLSVRQDAILAATQEPLAASVLQQPSGPPGWKTIRSFALIGTQDMVLPRPNRSSWLTAPTPPWSRSGPRTSG